VYLYVYITHPPPAASCPAT